MSFGKNVEASAIEFLDDGVYLVEKGGMKSGLQILSELLGLEPVSRAQYES